VFVQASPSITALLLATTLNNGAVSSGGLHLFYRARHYIALTTLAFPLARFKLIHNYDSLTCPHSRSPVPVLSSSRLTISYVCHPVYQFFPYLLPAPHIYHETPVFANPTMIAYTPCSVYISLPRELSST
jgi:hypothetical protein